MADLTPPPEGMGVDAGNTQAFCLHSSPLQGRSTSSGEHRPAFYFLGPKVPPPHQHTQRLRVKGCSHVLSFIQQTPKCLLRFKEMEMKASSGAIRKAETAGPLGGTHGDTQVPGEGEGTTASGVGKTLLCT